MFIVYYRYIQIHKINLDCNQFTKITVVRGNSFQDTAAAGTASLNSVIKVDRKRRAEGPHNVWI